MITVRVLLSSKHHKHLTNYTTHIHQNVSVRLQYPNAGPNGQFGKSPQGYGPQTMNNPNYLPQQQMRPSMRPQNYGGQSGGSYYPQAQMNGMAPHPQAPPYDQQYGAPQYPQQTMQVSENLEFLLELDCPNIFIIIKKFITV